MILATDTKTLAVTVDVENVETYYYQTASTASAPAKPTTATPSGWQATEYAFDASKAVWTCQKTTLTDGTFRWGEVSKWSAYEGAVVSKNAADAAQSTANSANAREQRIYKSAASGTASMAATTTWITSAADAQNAWTAKRPTFSRDYPVLFTATQRQTVAQQAAGSTCTCTTPYVDESAAVAGNYITKVSTGGDAWVHSEGHGPDANGNATANTYGWRIGSVFELVRAGLSYLKMWVDNSVAKVRVGLESAGHSVFSPYGMEVFTDADTSVAKFGASGARVGKQAGPRTVIQSTGVDMYGASDGSEQLAHFGYGDTWSMGNTQTTKPYYQIGKPLSEPSAWVSGTSYNVGDVVSYDGKRWVCRVATSSTTSPPGIYWQLVNGSYSMSEGTQTIAGGENSHAEGYRTKALGEDSHAEGSMTIAILQCAHAEGYGTLANHYYSHAEGYCTKANGQKSHAGGDNTIAQHGQYAIGRWNEADNSGAPVYAFIIGNGTEDARSNALAVGWDGAIYSQAMAGIIQMFAGSTAPSGWLVCDGSAVSRTTYATLFAAIGTTWGTGNGSTTFNLPDLRGRAPIGAGTGSGLTARTLGSTGGSEALQSHDHNAASNGYNVPGKSGGWNWRTTSSGSNSNYNNTPMGGSTAAVASITKTGSAGSGNAGNMQPFAVINFIICTGKTS